MTRALHGGRVGLPPPDAAADVLVIAAWIGARGFQARITYAQGADPADRASLVLLDRSQVLDLVAGWLEQVERDVAPPGRTTAAPPTAGPPTAGPPPSAGPPPPI